MSKTNVMAKRRNCYYSTVEALLCEQEEEAAVHLPGPCEVRNLVRIAGAVHVFCLSISRNRTRLRRCMISEPCDRTPL